MSKPIDQIVARHLEYFGYEIRAAGRLDLRRAPGAAQHPPPRVRARRPPALPDSDGNESHREASSSRGLRRTMSSTVARLTFGRDAEGTWFVRIRALLSGAYTAACSGCSSMRGTRTSRSFAPRRARRRQRTKRRRRSRKSARLRIEPARESPIPERRSGERMARDLPCQATSIQSVLFTEGPVEAGREVADVEQPTSPSVAPFQDALRGVPGAESQVQVPARGSRRSRPHAVLPVLPRRDQPTRSRRLRERASPPVLRSSSSPQISPAAGAGRTRDRAPTAHARPSAARVLRRVVTGPLHSLLTSVVAPKRVARLGAARARTCKEPQPSALSASVGYCLDGRPRATDGPGNRPEQARSGGADALAAPSLLRRR